jgi:Leucine-rich repeat (LRR) protein
LALLAIGDVSAVWAAPAPATDREPTPAEVEVAKQAYEKLGGTYEFRRDYRTGSTYHLFSLNPGLSPDVLKQLPDPNFSYFLFLGIELQEASPKELARLRGLRRLQLQRNPGLTDAILAELAAVPRLERLDLECRQITDQGVKSLAAVRELRSLELLGVQVTDDGLKELANFPKLEELSLSVLERVTDTGLKELGRLKRLRSLKIHVRQVTAEGIGDLAGLQGLQTLSLSGTPVGDRGTKEVARLENLRRLDLTGSGVTDARLKELARLKNIRQMELSGANLITDAGIKELTVHKGLQVIELLDVRDKITDAALRDLAGLKELKVVEIAGGRRVTDAGLKELAGLPKLASLELFATEITDAGAKELLTRREELEVLRLGQTRVSDEITPLLLKQKQLRFVDLSYCPAVTDESVKHLANCKGLELLEVHRSGITPRGMAELWRSLPDCRVIPRPPANEPRPGSGGKKEPK